MKNYNYSHGYKSPSSKSEVSPFNNQNFLKVTPKNQPIFNTQLKALQQSNQYQINDEIISINNNQDKMNSCKIDNAILQQQYYHSQGSSQRQSQQNKEAILDNKILENDPFLIQLSKEIDIQAAIEKKNIMKDRFPIRYKELVNTQRQFLVYKQQHKIQKQKNKQESFKYCQQIKSLKQNIETLQKSIEGKNRALQCYKNDEAINIESLKNKHLKAINVLKNQHTKYQEKIKKLLQQVQTKNKQIKSLQLCVTQLKEQSVLLKEDNNRLTLQINLINTENSNKFKSQEQNIDICQQALKQKQIQLKKLTDQIQVVYQKNTELLTDKNHEKNRAQNLQRIFKQNQDRVQKLQQELKQCKDQFEQLLHQQRLKYLQQFREKNAIADQIQDQKIKMQQFLLKQKDLTQQIDKLQSKLLVLEADLKTERYGHVQDFTKLEKQNSLLTEKIKQIEIKYKGEIKQLSWSLDKSNNELNEKKQLLSKNLIKIESLIKNTAQMQKQNHQLHQFKKQKTSQFQLKKATFKQTTDQLKKQIKNYQIIIEGKNEYIQQLREKNNEHRQTINYTKIDYENLKSNYQQLQEKLYAQSQNTINNIYEKNSLIAELQRDLTSLSLKYQSKMENLEEDKLTLSKKVVKLQHDLLQAKSAKSNAEKTSQQKQSQFQCRINILQSELSSLKQNQQNLVNSHNQSQQKNRQEFIELLRVKDQLTEKLENKTLYSNKLQSRVQFLEEENISTTKTLQMVNQQYQKIREQVVKSRKEVILLQQKNQLLKQIQQREQLLHSNRQDTGLNQSFRKQNSKESCLGCQNYLTTIEEMRNQIMDLTLQFKQKSQEEQDLRFILLEQNKLLKLRN